MSNRSLLGTFLRIVRNILLIIAFFVFLGIAYIGLVIYLSRSPCVVLPNGYMLGYDAIFSRVLFSRMTMISPMTLRRPNGEVLVRGRRDVELLRDTDAPPYGIILEYSGGGRMKMPGQEMMPLIWDAEFFGREWYEPRKINPDNTSIIHTDFFLIYDELSRSRKFELVGCGTPWFDWGD